MLRIFSSSARLAVLGGVTLLAVASLSGCSAPTVQIDQASPSKGITANVQVVTDQAGGVTILAPVMIDGHGPYIFVVDTGASVSLIDRPIANRLGLTQSGDPQQVEGIGGTQTVIPVAISSWSLGNIKLPSTNIDKSSFSSLELGSNAVGLLGSDIWDRFGEVTLNYSAQTLTVYQQLSTSSVGTSANPM